MSAADTHRGSPPGRPALRHVPLGWTAALALAIAAPALVPGYVLLIDQVATPRSFLVPDAWGVGDAVPRAVPLDALVAGATFLVDGQLVQKAMLLAALVLAGWGASRLVPSSRVGTRSLAAVLYLWNPYVAERLVLGHWALLLAYGLMPWLVARLLRLRGGEPGSWPVLGLLLAGCALTPGGGVLSLLVALPVLVWSGGQDRLRRVATLVGVWLVVNAPWWVPGVLHPGGGTTAGTGVAAFAPRAELTGLGTWGSLLGGGGVWNADAVPATRSLFTASLFTALLVVLAAVGWPTLRRAWRGGAYGLAAAAALGLVLAGLTTLPGGSRALSWAVRELPGAGLLRDGQRLVAPLTLLIAVAAALGVERACARRANVRAGAFLAALVLPLLVLPDLAWGVAGRIRPVDYPSDWPAVARTLTAGDAIVLPWQPFRKFDWNRQTTALDPMPRYVRVTALTSDTLAVGGAVASGAEAPRATQVSMALSTGRPLVETMPNLGVSWVIVELLTPGDVDPNLFLGAEPVLKGPTVQLYRVGDVPSPGSASYAGWVAAVDLLAAAVVLGFAGTAVRNAARRRSRNGGP